MDVASHEFAGLQALTLPVLKLAAIGGQSVPGMEAAIAERFGLADEDRQIMLPSGRLRKRVDEDLFAEDEKPRARAGYRTDHTIFLREFAVLTGSASSDCRLSRAQVS